MVVVREPAADRSDAADLVRRFADAWAHPQVERFVSMLAADGFLLAALGRPSAWLGYLRYRGYVPARARADAEAGQRPADGSARRT